MLVKVLLPVGKISAWKIEGRKKGPHYVYYTVTAYRILRDNRDDPAAKKEAAGLLERALGREKTHYNFLPQRPFNPAAGDVDTGSGLLVGRIKGSAASPYLVPREELFTKDLLRIGYEDEKWHSIIKIKRYVPKKGRFYIPDTNKKGALKGVPVFLIDRLEPGIAGMISDLESRAKTIEIDTPRLYLRTERTRVSGRKPPVKDIRFYGYMPKKRMLPGTGLPLKYDYLMKISKKAAMDLCWILPPVILPDDEEEIKRDIKAAIKKGASGFVINSLWHISLFESMKRVNVTAGPFCNLANISAIIQAKKLGVKSAIVCPELGKEDYFSMPQKSPIPLGIVISGFLPLSIARIIPEGIETDSPLVSPKGEICFIKKTGGNYFVYPNWQIDLTSQKERLENAGYSIFVHLIEHIPKKINIKQRQGLWNWNIGLQ